MTQPSPPGSVQIDMGRVVQRATQAMAGSTAGLAAELGMAVEVSEARATRITELEQGLAELEQALAERNAEIGRLLAADEMLQERVRDLEARADAADDDEVHG